MAPSAPSPSVAFTEKDFYLQEFRGRTLALCAPDAAALAHATEVGRELVEHGIRVLALAPADALAGTAALSVDAPRLEGEVWRRLRERRMLPLAVPAGPAFEKTCGQLVVRLGVGKLVFLDPAGGLSRADGRRASFVGLEELGSWAADPNHHRVALLGVVQELLEAGVPAVNVCSAEGLADELFTYAGSGTLFTRERYLVVRSLTLDDYAAALDLMARGVSEGYLAPRSEADSDGILAGGFGAFVEGRHLAGIGALLPHADARSGEIASLYTLTRFMGEGVGAHLVGHALGRAAEIGLERVFACTTQERVGAFFARQGFAEVDPDVLPPGRWEGYDPARRARLRCYAIAVAGN